MNSQKQSIPELSHDEIAVLAFDISQSLEGQRRSAFDNWLEAERILKKRKLEAQGATGRSAASAAKKPTRKKALSK